MLDIGLEIENLEYGQEVYNAAADAETMTKAMRIIMKALDGVSEALIRDGYNNIGTMLRIQAELILEGS